MWVYIPTNRWRSAGPETVHLAVTRPVATVPVTNLAIRTPGAITALPARRTDCELHVIVLRLGRSNQQIRTLVENNKRMSRAGVHDRMIANGVSASLGRVHADLEIIAVLATLGRAQVPLGSVQRTLAPIGVAAGQDGWPEGGV